MIRYHFQASSNAFLRRFLKYLPTLQEHLRTCQLATTVLFTLPTVHLNSIAILYEELFIKRNIFYSLSSSLEDQETKLDRQFCQEVYDLMSIGCTHLSSFTTVCFIRLSLLSSMFKASRGLESGSPQPLPYGQLSLVKRKRKDVSFDGGPQGCSHEAKRSCSSGTLQALNIRFLGEA